MGDDDVMSELVELVGLLRRHRLNVMAERLMRQEADRDRRSTVKRLLEIVRAEDEAKAARSLERRTREARLPIERADLSDVVYTTERGLLKSELDPFRDCRWIREREHLVLVGASGRGTTFLACALAQAALRDGLRVRYEEVQTLIAQWYAAHDAGRSDEFLGHLERADLLVLDDFGTTDETLGAEDIRALRRCLRPMLDHRSVLVASKHHPENLTDWLRGRETAEELVGWLSKVAHRLVLKGPSMRTRQPRPRGGRFIERSSR